MLFPAVLAAAALLFTDPAGDASGAPDITSVSVAPGPTRLTFTIRTADAAAWDGAAAILDLRTDAGDLSYVLHSLHDEFTLDRGSVHVAHPAATATLAGADLTITVPLSELGHTSRLTFRVSTPSPAGTDEAPDASSPAWVVSLTSFAPAAPVHGKTFAFTARGAACRATLNSITLTGACRWHIPTTATGKTLLVVVTADGTKRRYRFRVR